MGIRAALFRSMAFKLTLEVGALKGSRKEEDFSLGSPHLERVFSFSDVHSDLSPLSMVPVKL